MYEKLDFLIIEAIHARKELSFAQMQCGEAQKEAERIATLRKRESFRVLDGRLQALKKRDLIRFSGGAWREVPK